MGKDHICKPDNTGSCWRCEVQRPRPIVVRRNEGISSWTLPWTIEVTNAISSLRVVDLKTSELIILRDQINKALEEGAED
jgi:hypothetical protein